MRLRVEVRAIAKRLDGNPAALALVAQVVAALAARGVRDRRRKPKRPR